MIIMLAFVLLSSFNFFFTFHCLFLFNVGWFCVFGWSEVSGISGSWELFFSLSLLASLFNLNAFLVFAYVNCFIACSST